MSRSASTLTRHPKPRTTTAAAGHGLKTSKRWEAADFQQRRKMILQTAMGLLHRHGNRRLTMRQVAAKLGIGVMTLYTYYPNHHELLREIILEGFRLLNEGCEQASTLDTPKKWWGGSRHYLQFALDNPHLYELMFSVALPAESDPHKILESEFGHLLEKVTERYARTHGWTGQKLHRQAKDAAGRFWIGLHGLASLAIANRLVVLDRELDELLADLLKHIAPD